ncbi:MAG: hypothetical protein AB7J28_14575 [Hyphomonadaceae bacterium]
MAGYHLYFRTNEDRLGGMTVRVCDTDEQALDWARSLLDRHPCVEVWRGDDFIGAVECAPQPA